MKNNLKYLFLTLLVIGLYSCDLDNKGIEGDDVKGNSILVDNEISVFDINEDLEIKFYTAEGISVKSLAVNMDDAKIADATISGNEATFSSSLLGNFLFSKGNKYVRTGNYKIDFLTTLSNDEQYVNYYTISVDHAIKMDDESSSVLFNDTTTQDISYKTSTAHATIDNVKVQWKKNKSGTYADASHTFTDKNRSIDLSDLDYKSKYSLVVGDTLYYQFIATSGTLKDTTVTSVAVVPQVMDNPTDGAIASTIDTTYNFTDVDSEKNEIIFVKPFGFKVVADAAMGLNFVAITLPSGVTGSKYFDAGDIVDAKTQYASGTKVTSVTGLTKDKVFVYKAIRAEKRKEIVVNQTYYGLLKIGDVINVNSNDVEKLSFKFKEGYLIGE